MARHLRALLGPMLLDRPLGVCQPAFPEVPHETRCPERERAGDWPGGQLDLDQLPPPPLATEGEDLAKGRSLAGSSLLEEERRPQRPLVSDEDEAAEMEDEAVRSQVQHKSKVRGGCGGRGQPGALHPSSPSIALCGMFALSGCSVAAIQTLCPLSLLLSGFLALSVPACPNL